ncbi:unnamed protein product [Microthlaspi erraticum]|uniref:Uncharacterized protein n=1 Tax=Microthlaspi erraticum TaxID=1685480 RepID=A0A6D2K1F3_9BRAS|nr:unnamed protein product [Microthlaspi erraticum]
MVAINELSDDLLLKILSFLPTKVAVSTSLLPKQWKFFWMLWPKLEYDDLELSASSALSCLDFIDKNLPLHRAPVIETLLLRFRHTNLLEHEKIKLWVGIAVSRFVRELSISYFCFIRKRPDVLSLPRSLYTCNSLMTLKLQGWNILVDVPPLVCLPSLKTLQLRFVTYSDEDSLRLLLSSCPVLEDLLIERSNQNDNLIEIVVNVPSLQRLNLRIGRNCSSHGYSIVTPCLKHFEIEDCRDFPSFMIEPMPVLEEADIDVRIDIEKILELITSVRRLSLHSSFMNAKESVYLAGIVFNQLEHLKLSIDKTDWSELLFRLLRKSPKLRVLNLSVERDSKVTKDQTAKRKNKGSSIPECLLTSSIPECLLRSLETLEFSGYTGAEEEIHFLRFLDRHARCLKTNSQTLVSKYLNEVRIINGFSLDKRFSDFDDAEWFFDH